MENKTIDKAQILASQAEFLHEKMVEAQTALLESERREDDLVTYHKAQAHLLACQQMFNKILEDFDA